MKRLLWAMVLALPACGGEPDNVAEAPWDRVKRILAQTDSIVVLDGTELCPLKDPRGGTPVYGDWLVQHFLSDPENFNPYTSNDAGASQIQQYVFETLLYPEIQPPYPLKGYLAKDYPAISPDFRSYTFDLREDVTFADGNPMTADDVLFSLKVIKHPHVLAAPLRSYFSAIQDVRKEGPYRITFQCKEPYFKNDMVIGGYMAIIPRHFYDPEGLMEKVTVRSLDDGSWETGPGAALAKRFAEGFNRDFNRKMMGSGPYRVEDWERDVVTGQKVVLTRNSGYWGAALRKPARGWFDKVVFKIINNTDAAFIELSNGNLDLYGLHPLEFKEKSWSPEFTSRFLKGIEYSSGFTYIGWNNNHPLFRDARVRKAMTHLTDRDGMVRDLLFGLGEPVESPIHKFRPEYNHDLTPYAYDLERGVALLKEAGWIDRDNDGVLDNTLDGQKTDFRFEFLVNSGNQIRKDIALVLQNGLREVGIVCEVRELDWSIFLERVTKSQDFAACTLGWTGSLRFAPDAYQIWHSSQATQGGSNYIGFKNAEVDRILEDYRRTFDLDTRVRMYRRFQEILHEEQPYTFLWKQRSATAYSKRFRGVTWYPAGADDKEWYVAEEERLYP